jgi:hypothetical protein
LIKRFGRNWSGLRRYEHSHDHRRDKDTELVGLRCPVRIAQRFINVVFNYFSHYEQRI